MPRRQRVLAQSNVIPFPSRSLVASATRYDGKTARIFNSDAGTWQAEAYRHYRICGEARFAAQFFGHALSKAILYVPSDPTKPHSEPATTGPAVEALEELFNGCDGQAAMLSAIGVHLTIAGECYLIGRMADDIQIWEIRSVLEVKSNGNSVNNNGKWWIEQGGGQPNIAIAPDDVVIRIWSPDPARAINADSPFRSLLPILEEIEYLTRYVFTQCQSRLLSAGVWMVPEEVDFPPAPGKNGTDEGTKADGLLTMLADVMVAASNDANSAAAKIPSVITMPGEHIAAAKEGWMTFWSELDAEAKSLREEAIKRFALGMDLPPERVLGMSSNMGAGGGKSSGVSHWGAWQIDEDTIKMHVEPMLDVVVAAVSIYYLRPGIDDPRATVYYNTADLRLRPDRSAEAMELYDRGLVKGAVAASENGFTPDEMMTPEEQKLWLLFKIAGGSATPEMVNAALKQLGVDLGPITDGGQINEARPIPSLEDHPERDLPEQNARLLAACEPLVYRALERAGNRLKQISRSKGGSPMMVPSYEVHTIVQANGNCETLLADAWPLATKVLDADAEKIVPILNAYTSSLLTTGQEYDRTTLSKALEKA